MADTLPMKMDHDVKLDGTEVNMTVPFFFFLFLHF